jgi:CheY-like chemotaxis protein
VPQTLLLADDSVTIQRVIELTFADEDINVVAVSDGDQAIARLDTMPPDIVLVDVGMPGRSGYDVADHVKHTPHLSHIPVVLLTGAFEPVDEVKANAIGCDGVLAKPFEPQNIISRVKELLGKPAPVAAVAALADGLAMFPPELQDQNAEHAVAEAPISNEAAAKLDEYFDQLDSAFARFTSSQVVKPADLLPADEDAAPADLDWFAPPASETPAAFDSSLALNPPADPSGLQLPDDSELVREFQLFKAPPIVHPAEPAEEPAEELEAVESEAVEDAEAIEPEPAAAPEPVAMPELAAVAVAAPEPAAVPEPVPALAVAAVPELVAYTQAALPDELVAERALAVGQPLALVPSVPRELPPLGDAFAAILAAEHGDAGTPAAWPAPASAAVAPVITDDVIDRVSRRVIEQLTDSVVREAVANAVSSVAERLVREEIERIKSAIKD